jgi:hypothetical protein
MYGRGMKWNIHAVLRYEHKRKFLETDYNAAGTLTLAICLHYEHHSPHTPGCKGAARAQRCCNTVIRLYHATWSHIPLLHQDVPL